MIVGRAREFDAIASFVSAIGDGPQACVIEGEPGIGKTTLFEECVERAESAGLRTARATQAEPEASFAYAVLVDVVRDLLPDVRDRLRLEGIEPGDLDPQQFTAFVAAELKRWGPVVRASGAQAD